VDVAVHGFIPEAITAPEANKAIAPGPWYRSPVWRKDHLNTTPLCSIVRTIVSDHLGPIRFVQVVQVVVSGGVILVVFNLSGFVFNLSSFGSLLAALQKDSKSPEQQQATN